MKFTPIVIIKQLSGSIITLLADRIIRLFLIMITPATFYLSKLKDELSHVMSICDSQALEQETDIPLCVFFCIVLSWRSHRLVQKLRRLITSQWDIECYFTLSATSGCSFLL